MKKILLSAIIGLLLLVTIAAAVDVIPTGDYDFKNRYAIKNATSLTLNNSASRLCFGAICFNGTNIGSGYTADNLYIFLTGSTLFEFNQTRNNLTIDARIGSVTSGLATNITAEATARSSVDTSHNTSIASLASNASGVQSSIASLATNMTGFQSSISSVVTNLSAEATARSSVDTSHNTSIASLASNASGVQSSIASLAANDSTEANTRAAYDAASYTNVSSLRATTASLATNDSTEASTRAAYDAASYTNVTALQTATSSLATNDSTLATRINQVNGTKLNSTSPQFTGNLTGASGSRIGIATAVPAQALDVNGSAVVNGTLTASVIRGSVQWSDINSSSYPSSAPSADMYATAVGSSITYTDVRTAGLNSSIVSRTGVTNQSGNVQVPHTLNVTKNATIGDLGTTLGATLAVGQNVAGAIGFILARDSSLYISDYVPHGTPSYSERKVNGASEVWRIYLATGSGFTAGDIAFQNDLFGLGIANFTGNIIGGANLDVSGNVSIGTGTDILSIQYNSSNGQVELDPIGTAGAIRVQGTVNSTTNFCIEGGNCLSNVTQGLVSNVGNTQANIVTTDEDNYTLFRRNGQAGINFGPGTQSGSSTVEELNVTPKISFNYSNPFTYLICLNISQNATSGNNYGYFGENNKIVLGANGANTEFVLRNTTSGTRSNSNTTKLGWQCLAGVNDGAGTVTLWRDGVLIDSDSISALGHLQNTSNSLKIMGNTVGSGTFNASKRSDQVCKGGIWARALSSAELTFDTNLSKNPCNNPTNASNPAFTFMLNVSGGAYNDDTVVFDIEYITDKKYTHRFVDANNVTVQPILGNTVVNGTLNATGLTFINGMCFAGTNYPACSATYSGCFGYNTSTFKHVGCNSTAWNNLY